MKTTTTVLFMFALLFVTGCSSNLVPYSTSNRLDDEIERKIQFRLAKDVDIILERVMSESETKVSNGTVFIRNGKKINQIIFPGGTKCVIINRLGDIIWISLEKSDDLWLPFEESADKKNTYTLISSDSLKYGDDEKRYGIVSGKYSQIICNMEKSDPIKKHRHFAKGRKVK